MDIERLRQRFPDRAIHYFESLPSTMTVAAQLAAEGCAHGSAVIAGEQTTGQGRHGRQWQSEAGSGVYLTLVLRPLFPPAAFPVLTLAVGLAACEAIEEVTGLACDLRWPNDLLLSGKKCGGILLNLEAGAVVAGIGINVGHTAFPPELAEVATSLRLVSGREHPRESLLAALFEAVDRYCDLVTSQGVEPVLRLFTARSSYAMGRRVVVDQPGEQIEGVTAGLDENGFLRVRKDNGVVVMVLAGGVRPLEGA
jgi:BirA family biotin operon repressor/biotin-[acetyl-CoA-carboxylase] ligase